MGAVYLSSTPGGHPVALKVIRREFAQDPEFRRRFTREVEAAHRVQGPYTATVLDSETEGDQPWLASSYVPGPSLSSAVQQHGPLPVTSVLMLTAGIAEALQAIHAAGVVHRDLKPSNVLLASDGPRVIDFGISRAADATALTGTDVRLGTPAYMSPEQADGEPATPAVDVFALGLVVFYAATGRHPFGDGDGHALLYRIVMRAPDLTGCPEAVLPLVQRCLAKEPGARPEPQSLVEECRDIAESLGAGLSRGEGWWLPGSVAAEVGEAPAPVPEPPEPASPEPAPAPEPARREPSPDPAAPEAPYAAPPAVPPPPAGPPPQPAGPPPSAQPFGPAPQLPQPAGRKGRRGRLGGRAGIAGLAVGAVAVVAVAAVVVTKALSDGTSASGHSGSSSGGGAADGKVGKGATVRLAATPWDESVATTYLWKAVLERRGYRVETKKLDPPRAFGAVAAQQADVTTDAWLPRTHAQYMTQYRGRVTDLGEWSGKTSLQVAVPSYVKGVRSMADLKGKAKTFDGKIVGIEPGAGEMQLLKNKVLPGYGLDGEYRLESGSTAAMLTELRRAYAQHKPVAVVLWEPHWAYGKYKLTKVSDPKGLWGEADSIHAVAAPDFAHKQPRVAGWLRHFRMTMPELDSLEAEIQDAGPDDPMKGVRHWMARHPGTVGKLAPVKD